RSIRYVSGIRSGPALPMQGCGSTLKGPVSRHLWLVPGVAVQLSEPAAIPESASGLLRIHAVVALRLLEALRDQDLPIELLEDENPSRTMPRRFGLSDVVERQIRTFKAEARKGARLSEEQVGDLFRFVIRRPDGRQVFQNVGRSLVDSSRSPGWTRWLPARTRYGVARSRARRKLRRLFGRRLGGFARGPFILEGRSLFFVESDPSGDACHLLSGFCEAVIEGVTGAPTSVEHTLCQARGDTVCRWELRPSDGSVPH
ncbi:MAG: 4-vinyl reductase, partial [Thioalkalivibrio sp.]|nr:4-vinyl reductase [Thioalkalivibrio sp.]